MKPWQLGNTTVRSGLRTRDALVALDNAGIEGQIRGREGDERFRQLLGEGGVVNLGTDDTISVGRKFRSAMAQLGFLFPLASSRVQQKDIGPLDCISPAGHRFILARSPVAQQECFLRSLVGRSINLSSARYLSPGLFSPLLHILRIMTELERVCGDSRISFIEFAIYVQVTDHTEDVEALVNHIFGYREHRQQAQNKKHFDAKALQAQRKSDGDVVAVSTYRDYADMNFRYLRATGLFSQRGRGIGFFEHRRELVAQLIEEIQPISEPVPYWKNLTNGPRLPFDGVESARKNLADLIQTAEAKRIAIEIDLSNVLTAADAELARHELEERIAVVDEIEYSRAQAGEWEQITQYLMVLEPGRVRSAGFDEEVVVIPTGEAPAYLEWAVWRAFLAINQLQNPPNKSRRFPIDRDFLPLNHAPGGGPDLVFEFESFVLVVEVTLLTSGRQEAAEGYSVRQHVFQVKKQYEQAGNKPVYALFVAPILNPNSVATFQLGQWYEEDVEIRLDIVPVTIRQFNTLFAAMFSNNSVDYSHIYQFVMRCLETRGVVGRPSEWQQSISENVEYAVASYSITVG